MLNNTPGIKGILTACFKSVLPCVKILTKSSVTPKILIIYQKDLFKSIPNSISKFSKVLKILRPIPLPPLSMLFEQFEIKKIAPKLCFFVSLLSDSC